MYSYALHYGNYLSIFSFPSQEKTLIRVYDDAGNVIETHEHKGRLQRASGERALLGKLLLIVQTRLRCRFAHFELCAHFLQAHSEGQESSNEHPIPKIVHNPAS